MKDQTLNRVNSAQPVYPWMLPLALMSMLGYAQTAIAHGVDLQYQTTQAIWVQATYDTGAPLANAQVTVYAPDSDTPWLKGTTDGQGKFTFTPDPTKSGIWQVKARLAGHGDVLNIAVGEAGSAGAIAADRTYLEASRGTTGYTPLQKGVMAASVIWGAIGTALFFVRRKR